MSLRTFLLGLGNVLRGTPKALHLASMQDALKEDFARTTAKAGEELRAGYDRINSEIASEVETAKVLLQGAHDRVAALKEHGLMEEYEHFALLEHLKGTVEKVFGAS